MGVGHGSLRAQERGHPVFTLLVRGQLGGRLHEGRDRSDGRTGQLAGLAPDRGPVPIETGRRHLHARQRLRSRSGRGEPHRRRIGLVLVRTRQRKTDRVEIRDVPLEESVNGARDAAGLGFQPNGELLPDDAKAVDPIARTRMAAREVTQLMREHGLELLDREALEQ